MLNCEKTRELFLFFDLCIEYPVLLKKFTNPSVYHQYSTKKLEARREQNYFKSVNLDNFYRQIILLIDFLEEESRKHNWILKKIDYKYLLCDLPINEEFNQILYKHVIIKGTTLTEDSVFIKLQSTEKKKDLKTYEKRLKKISHKRINYEKLNLFPY